MQSYSLLGRLKGYPERRSATVSSLLVAVWRPWGAAFAHRSRLEAQLMNNGIVITFGTFDVFHVGHLRILQRARSFGSELIVGISTDALNFDKKGKFPVYTQEERREIVDALTCVKQTFYEESLDLKGEYIQRFEADILVMGDDWKGKFDEFSSLCEVVYLPRTPAISTTEVIEKIRL